MSTDERFIELWNDYLEGELDETGTTELRRLLAQDDRLVQMAADSYRTHRLLGLMAQDSESQQDDFVQQTLNRLPAEDDHFVWRRHAAGFAWENRDGTPANPFPRHLEVDHAFPSFPCFCCGRLGDRYWSNCRVVKWTWNRAGLRSLHRANP